MGLAVLEEPVEVLQMAYAGGGGRDDGFDDGGGGDDDPPEWGDRDDPDEEGSEKTGSRERSNRLFWLKMGGVYVVLFFLYWYGIRDMSDEIIRENRKRSDALLRSWEESKRTSEEQFRVWQERQGQMHRKRMEAHNESLRELEREHQIFLDQMNEENRGAVLEILDSLVGYTDEAKLQFLVKSGFSTEVASDHVRRWREYRRQER